MKRSRSRAEKPVVVALKGRADEAVWLAAHLMTERAFVRLAPRAGGVSVELRPKSGSGAGLAAEFARALVSEKRRWAASKAALPERAAALSRALELSARMGAALQETQGLPPAQARALSELAAAPVPDPHGVRTPWSELERK